MSSKKTYITDTNNNKVFPETTIDQIFEANGTDKFKVVQEFTEEEWEAKSDEEKAKIPLAKVLKKFIQRASNILYKNGKSVEKELDDINTNLPQIKSLGNFTTDSSGNFNIGYDGHVVLNAWIIEQNKYYNLKPWYSITEGAWYIKVLSAEANNASVTNTTINDVYIAYI